MDNIIDLAICTAKNAGVIILEHYKKVIRKSYKDNNSPFTETYQYSHNYIISSLASADLPIVSEEGKELHFQAQRYCLVDPLDGTKVFLDGKGEFTVNIAIVNDVIPVLGMLYAPLTDDSFWGEVGVGAWRNKQGTYSELKLSCASTECRIAKSKFHDSPELDRFVSENRIKHRITIGSALNFGLLAAAKIDLFPRLVGSSEWDTAAGQAILEAAGGRVVNWHTGLPLVYGKKDRRNPRFLAMRAPYRFENFQIQQYEDNLL